jgi:purine-binding chemotaxis protein CheW
MSSLLHVLFKVADAEYALPASEVLQMDSFAGATPVPGTAGYVAGLVQVRGRVVPILDLRVRFGLPTAPQTLDSRVVVVERNARVVGLLVDSAREVAEIPDAEVMPPPELVAGVAGGFVRAVARVSGRLLFLIDTGRIIGEEHEHGG